MGVSGVGVGGPSDCGVATFVAGAGAEFVFFTGRFRGSVLGARVGGAKHIPSAFLSFWGQSYSFA